MQRSPLVQPSGRHVASLVVSGLAVLAASCEALAHASDRGHVLLLPTGHYLVAGALAVAASFVATAFLPPGAGRRALGWRLPLGSVPDGWRFWTSLASFLALLGLVAAGFFGSRDPLSNPLPLVVWTLIWVGVTILQGCLGNLWHWIDPWHAPLASLRRFWPRRLRLGLPRGIDAWPALLLFLGFAWFELVDVAPDDPSRLAAAVSVYWLATAAGMLVFGERRWRRSVEFLSILFGLIARLSCLEARARPSGRGSVSLCLPGAKLAGAAPLSPSAMLLLLAALASVSFDGFSRTFVWLDAVGVNPLEFPGRTAMLGVNTAGLLVAVLLLGGVFVGSAAVGERMAGSARWAEASGSLVWSIVPIALAYHFSHYLVVLLVNGQYAAVALSDPFSIGWNLFGTATMPVSAGIAMGSDAAWTVWNVQAAAIIGGHVLAVLIAHAIAGRLHPDPRRARASQVPMTVLMVTYTVFGLWLLSTPTGA